jgi:MarR family transcriptional regulator, transcriptional regulator for hemolysin
MSNSNAAETFGQLLHGTARAWRQRLDQRLKPMGLSQAKWRTLMHLSLAEDALTQAEIAARLGVEEPSVVTLLHRLEREAWITRTNSSHDRRCKMVLLGRRAQRVIAQINATAQKLRHELLADIPKSDLQACMRVLARIRGRAEKGNRREFITARQQVAFLTNTTARPNTEIRFQQKRRFAARRRAPNETSHGD